jgi:hypothetical protein
VGATLGHLGEGLGLDFVSASFPGPRFFLLFVHCVTFGFKMMPAMESYFLPACLQMAAFLDKAPASGPSGSRSVLGCPNCSQMLPQGAKRGSKIEGSARCMS